MAQVRGRLCETSRLIPGYSHKLFGLLSEQCTCSSFTVKKRALTERRGLRLQLRKLQTVSICLGRTVETAWVTNPCIRSKVYDVRFYFYKLKKETIRI